MPIAHISDAQQMTLDALAEAVTKARDYKLTSSLFHELPATPGTTVSTIFDAMKADGYTFGQPRRARTSKVIGHTEWHVVITKNNIQFALAFYIPEDV